MTITLQLVLLVVTLFLIYAAVFGFSNKRPNKRPPGPFAWPYFGNVRLLRGLSGKLGGQHEALYHLSKQYKSPLISLRFGNRDTVVVSGIKAINQVLNGEEYDGRPWNYFIQMRNMGKKRGLTMNDGEVWRDIRSWFVRSMRSIGFARREMVDSIKEELREVLDKIKLDSDVRSMKPLIVPAIINILWNFAAGQRLSEDKLKSLIELMDKRAKSLDMMGGILSAFPWIRFIAPEWSGYNVLVAINNEFKALIMETIEEHKKNYVPGSETDLIDMFLNEMYSGKGPQAGYDDDQLVMILVDILLAGLNITATTLDFLFLNMVINQDAQKLLHEEIDQTIGMDKSPDFNDQSRMPYTESVILESQRLAPVVPVIGPRRVLRDTCLEGYDLPKDSILVMNLRSIHVDPELYPEPYEFKPERFIRDGHRICDKNLFFFGKGKRQCPGLSLAKSAVFLLFTGIMQHYELKPVPGKPAPTLQYNPGMTMSPKPYEVLVVPRDATS
ncbi:probable cytochrome P450 305a1 [Trichogramma pretiosum]|uniref:probable cytochrome P450 305a1 n=1 Tax=Trichogramma pretiosum TaxID=7493 RepID=UPI0006C9E0D0|nr:probable cytochrome P450 305a1 [Trichogramma pretiosum]